MKWLLILSILVLNLTSSPTYAYGYCSEPSREPWCLTDGDTFRDEGDFENCRWEVERFVKSVNDYVDCLQSEQESNSREAEELQMQIEELVDEINEMQSDKDEALESAKKVIDRFNCGAESGDACW